MLTGKGLVDYCREKLGTPYFFGAKMQILTNEYMAAMQKAYPGTVTTKYIAKAIGRGQVGKINTDCSGLIGGYRGQQIGSAQLYQTAQKRLSIKESDKWADGVICWRNGHVGVFFRENGKKYVYEAKGIDYGTVKSDFVESKWTCGLTFSDMEYSYSEPVSEKTQKSQNPFPEPKENLKISAKGNGVKWLQFELNESGSELSIDGEFGPLTDTELRRFQKSCKIAVDGICGKITRECLKLDSGSKNPGEDKGSMRFGVDVSKYQGEIDWKKVRAAGMSFAVLKVTKRNNQVEESFERNYAGCKAAGIPIGVYRYVYATTVEAAEAEARAIITVLHGKQIEGEIWLDMEDSSIAKVGKTGLTRIINAEAEILKAAGYTVGVYCNRDWYEKTLEGNILSQYYKIWIAKYGKNMGNWEGRSDNPRDIAYAWQYTSKGRVDGIKGDVDLDLIY